MNQHIALVGEFEEKPVRDYIKDAVGTDITQCLQARDAEWRKRMEEPLYRPVPRSAREIASQSKANAPILLINKAQGALNSIDCDSDGFAGNAVQIRKGLEDLIRKAEELKDKLNG